MLESKKLSSWEYTKWMLLRLALVIFDAIAVNASFFIALVLRFYIQHEFHSAGVPYVEAFSNYAPIYTVYCLIVFSCFRLYSGMWRYIGINDLNRILSANGVCLVGHVVGTLLFGTRMPISFYGIGTFIQVFLVVGVRLSHRVFLTERDNLSAGRNRSSMNAMVIGSSVTGRSVVKQLEQENSLNPVCFLNYKAAGVTGMLDGMPYLYGLDGLEKNISKYRVRVVVIGDPMMPREMRSKIKDICRNAAVELQDYSGFYQNAAGNITFKSLVEYSTGPVQLIIDGNIQNYESGEQAFLNAPGNYVVKAISAKEDKLVIWLSSHRVVVNDVTEPWVKKLEKETGEEISFF